MRGNCGLYCRGELGKRHVRWRALEAVRKRVAIATILANLRAADAEMAAAKLPMVRNCFPVKGTRPEGTQTEAEASGKCARCLRRSRRATIC